MKIVLASKSPRRSQILSNIGMKFEVCESNIVEDFENVTDPAEVVKTLAYRKALDVAGRMEEEAMVIGADTIVVTDEEILGKPRNEEHSYEMLKNLSGKWHNVYTGLCIINTSAKRYLIDYEVTDVKFRELTNQEIWNYIRSGEPEDKAGSYAVQGKGSLIVERINGCYFNVVGLPVSKLYNMFKEFDVDLMGWQ